MASFKAKTSWERQRKRENRNFRSDQFLLDPEQKIAKKFIKLEDTIRASSLQAKTGCERPRKRDNKNYRSNQFLPEPQQKI